MSTRSTRKKSLPPKLLELEEEATPKSRKKRKERSSTPSSRVSSPDSRASSPGAVRVPRMSSTKKSAKGRKGRGSKSATPAGSRASSVTPVVKKKRGRAAGNKKSKPRGHNPDYNAAYHYGSDFEQDEEFHENENEKSSPSEESEVEDESDDMKPESDVETEPVLVERDSFTPIPFWLQEYANIPQLHLPPSSEDLCIEQGNVLQLVSVYEVLRQFRTIIRLSPFRIEDFAYALSSNEHNNLLSEIHMALLKCLWREDDGLQVSYTPLDQKDSVNVLLYMMDNITWPENLKFYLSSDPEANETVLNILQTTEYPFTSVENKLTVLSHLTNTVLATAAVREDLASEGQLPQEDHCRVCHRLGDMVICEICNGPFHGTCLEPPLYEIPEEDWICPVCADHMVEGVFDAQVSQPGDARHNVLGVDRRGAKYWFLARRIWVEELDGVCGYYSSREQLTELLECLDANMYETDLVQSLLDKREEIEEHMDITSRLTLANKPDTANSYLELENEAIAKVQEERRELKEREKLERKKAQAEVDKMIREEDESRMMKEKVNVGEIFESLEGNGMDVDVGESVREETVTDNVEGEEMETVSAPSSARQTRASSPVIIKKPELPAGDHFKLGQEKTYKQYVNQYTAVTHSLSRNQVKEETEKKTRLSHKFSLTDVSTYKWVGATEGSRQTLLASLRATIIKLEENLPMAFMHCNWPILRRPWMQAVQTSTNPGKDFARALTVLVMCIKPAILLPVWLDSLGHINIKKSLAQAKEEKKKADKKEKKEREDEEERLKPWMTWVKYTLPVRSLSVAKQKGEDYRAHGRNGWLWLTTNRAVKSADSTKMGLRAGPHRIAVKYTEMKSNTSKVVLIEPKAFAFLMKVQKERDDKELARMVTGEEQEEQEDDGKEKTDEEKRKENLKKLLDSSRIDLQEPSDEDLGHPESVVNVSAGFQNSARTLYPKSAKKTSLDDLLVRRIQLKNWETKKIELLNKMKDDAGVTKTEEEKEQSTVITSDIVEKVPESENIETWISKSKKKLFDGQKLLRDETGTGSSLTSCYSAECIAGNSSKCYSPTCSIKQERDFLKTITEIYTNVLKEAKMKEIVKMEIGDDFVFADKKTANDSMQDLVKTLLLKEKELSEQTMQSITSDPSLNGVKQEEVKTEEKADIKPDMKTESTRPAFNRCYSTEATSGTLYLKRIQSVADSKKGSRVVKYPLASTFSNKSKPMRSILVLVKHDLKKLARNGGLITTEGFNYNAKPNTGAWPYPCPRPLFKTSWMLRTASMTSIHAVAMQLRILWMCVKWDDMSTKPPALYDGKNQVTTDTEIVTTEIRKHRNIGRYSEVTQYWQRKISIPLDAPRKQVDYSPIRSGLRKRKRAESPVSADPRVEEVWVDEISLELWEIKAYRDRVDRDRERLTTRRQAGIITKAPERLDPSEDRKTRIFNQNLQDIKQRTEESLRQQREAFRAGRTATPEKQLISTGNYIKTNQGIKLIASKGSEAGNAAKKIFITKDGKIIGHQLAPPGKVAIPNLANKMVGGSPVTPVTPTVGAAQQSPVQQKVQIVKSADGKIQVRGLLPGQQLVQMPDGRLQIFSSNSPSVSGGTPVKTGDTVIQTASPQPSTLQPQQLLPKPSPVRSPSKTYTIQRNPNITPGPTTPIQPRPIQPAAAPQTPAAPAAPAAPVAGLGVGKQKVVGIQNLGNNTVTIQDGQLIVQGPDHEAATGIAKKLASGEAKLGNVNGKQVLVMLGQEEAPAPAPAPAPPPKPPTPPPPAPVVRPATALSSITVTAQLVQTGQGPRIILQGLQGVQLEQQQLTQIQQQVKTQLLKQQSLARQEGKVPPTKVSITLTGNFNRAPAEQQQTTHPPQPGGNQSVNSLDPPQVPVQPQQVVQQVQHQQVIQQQQQPQQQPQQPQQNNFLSQPPQVNSNPQQQPASSTNTTPVAKIASQQTIMANLPQSVIKQGQFIIKDGKKVLVLPQNVLAAHQARQKQLLQGSQPPPHPQSILLNSLSSPGKQSLNSRAEDGDKFELTDDYIQQTIKNALNSGNLTLEQQEKLINQLDGSDMADLSRVSRVKKGKRGKTGTIDPASGELMDDEWQPEPNQRTAARIQPQVVRRKPEVEQTSPVINNSLDLNIVQQPAIKSSPVRSIKKLSPVDEKKRQAVHNRLSSMLFKQKEQLKRDIAKKRALLEKELSVEISAEVESLKQQAQLKLNSQIGKRSYSEMTSPTQSSPLAKRRRRSDNSELFNTHGIKRDRLYCICKTKYDPTKFYVGCDICSNWFHGSCVGITAKMSKKMTDYVCSECKTAKDNEQIYCLCRQPYDDSQFYIGCEKCSDWFHGRCVGILQAEAENIEEYVCPRCDPNTKINMANMKPLDGQDYELLKKTFKMIQNNRCSIPFKQPVDPKVNPNYYNIVKEPMDLQTIETKVNYKEYGCMTDFIGDIMKIFENCRYFNQEGSNVAKSAFQLEQMLAKQMVLVREKLADNQ